MGVLNDSLAFAGVAQGASASSELDMAKQTDGADLRKEIQRLQRLEQLQTAGESFSQFKRCLESENTTQNQINTKQKEVEEMESKLEKVKSELLGLEEQKRAGKDTKRAKKRSYETAVEKLVHENGEAASCFRIVMEQAIGMPPGGRQLVLKQVRGSWRRSWTIRVLKNSADRGLEYASR
jgi:chromosome segregation ATPase